MDRVRTIYSTKSKVRKVNLVKDRDGFFHLTLSIEGDE